jgi:plasmid stabilization system protein ParE
MYRAATKKAIEIVRILHDSMELQRYIPLATDESGE